jgi:hypothetical protein
VVDAGLPAHVLRRVEDLLQALHQHSAVLTVLRPSVDTVHVTSTCTDTGTQTEAQRGKR